MNEKTILVVDDEEETRTLYAEILATAGFVTEQAFDGQAALESIRAQKPDVIITGISMPRLDGFGLVEALRQDPETAQIPIVFLSHQGREEDRQKAEALGADFILRDMTPPKELVARMQAKFSEKEFVVALDPTGHDAPKLAQVLGVSPDFLCSERGGAPWLLKLRLTDRQTKRFDAELTCL